MAEPITQVLGIVSIKNRGEYDENTWYEKLNTVRYQGQTYCAKTNTQGNLPTNTDYWDLMVEKGEKGDMPVKGVDYWTETDKAEIEVDLASDVTSKVTEQLGGLTSAAPTAVSSMSAMTDTNKIYVLSTNGHWYWNNGTDWIDGGVYQASVNTDDVNKLIAMQENLDNLYDESTEEYGYLSDSGNIVAGSVARTRKEFSSGFIPIDSSKKVTLIEYIPSDIDIEDTQALWQAVCTYNSAKEFIRRRTDLSTESFTLVDGTIIKKFTVDFNENEKFIRLSYRTYGVIKIRVLNDEINSYVEYYKSKNDLKNEENHIYFNNSQYEIEFGNINALTGRNESDTSVFRTRTKDYIRVGKGSKIYFKQDFYRKDPYYRAYSVRYYHFDKSYNTEIGDLGWIAANNVHEITEDCYIRMIFKMTGGSGPITEEMIQELNDNLVIEKKDFDMEEEQQEITKRYDNKYLKAVNHRGYNTVAPENTLSAFRLSKEKGFDYVECDVSFTSDGIPVLLHDNTINRTAREYDGSTISETIAIGSITFEEARQYDFGIYKSVAYQGEKIPSFEEFMLLCRNLNLHPYIEIKTNQALSTERAQLLIDIVKKYNMLRNVTWISFGLNQLTEIVNIDSKARLGYITNDVSQTTINNVLTLKTEENEVFLDINHPNTVTDSTIELCIENNVGVEVWTIDNETTLASLNNFISGVTSNILNVSKYNYEKFISENQYLS